MTLSVTGGAGACIWHFDLACSGAKTGHCVSLDPNVFEGDQVAIGKFTFVGAGAVVNKDVKPYALMVGVPARQIGWMSEFGVQIPLPLHGEGQYTCPHSGQMYVLSEGFLTR